jgi:hypothetical protein
MGNTASGPNNSTQTDGENISTLPYLIDEIAMHYMLTQNAIDLNKISDKEYHDKLIILTSNVIEKRLNNLEIGYLKNRIAGNENQIQDIMPANSKVKDKVINDISKFYIKIFTIYSSITSTFDPQYSYIDENGSNKTFYLKDTDEYKNIPNNVKPVLTQLTNPMSLCRKRLNILKNRYDDTTEPGSIILNPGEKLCSTESSAKLTDEIGIKELDSLYYDIFDYNTKQWSKKSNKMKKKYNKDLILFYRIFTGKKTKPANIKSFQDIELLDFKTLYSCTDNTFLSDIVISKENKLIKEYKEKIDLIQKSTEENRNKLYSILKELFVVKIVDDEKSYTINPSLTLDKILLLEEQTRISLLDLYISCEKYFIQALIIFENIYESKDYTISEYRKENLMKIEPQTPSINYKDTLTIPPPFQPFSQESMKTEEAKPAESSFFDYFKSAPQPTVTPTTVTPIPTLAPPSDSTAQPPIDSMTQPQSPAEPMMQPPSDSTSQPPIDSMTQPQSPAEPMMQPPIDSMTQPQSPAEPMMQPPSDSMTQPTTQPEPIPQPPSDLITQPQLQPPTDSMTQPQLQPPTDSMTQPQLQPPTDSMIQPSSETTTQDIPYKESTSESDSRYLNETKKDLIETDTISPQVPIALPQPQLRPVLPQPQLRPVLPQPPQITTMNQYKSPVSDQISIGQNGKEFDLNAYKEKIKNQNKPNNPAPKL